VGKCNCRRWGNVIVVDQGAVPLDIFHGPTAQLQGSRFQSEEHLLLYEVVDHRGLQAEARLFGPLMEVPDATVIGSVLGTVGCLEATTTIATDDEPS
jgi:hypothetical protein